MKTEYKDTYELAVGDTVYHYGNMFKLTERFTKMVVDSPECPPELVVWFHTEWKGFTGDGENPIPAHWRNKWAIQGNNRATWQVVI